MQAIIKDYQDKDESDEEISDREWREFVIGMDVQWNNAITDLCAKYQLSKEELHLVCLSLAGFPFSHLEYLLHLSRRTLYRKKSALLKRTVDFQAAFSAVTVNVINETTGETVYSELFTNPTSFAIDLSGKDTGDYMIELVSDEISLEGYFFL